MASVKRTRRIVRNEYSTKQAYPYVGQREVQLSIPAK